MDCKKAQLGEGNMTPSEQARADAMADAETLRLACRDLLGWSLYPRTLDAGYAIDWPQGDLATLAYHHAFLSARAAFCAVPGLRGDR